MVILTEMHFEYFKYYNVIEIFCSHKSEYFKNYSLMLYNNINPNKNIKDLILKYP